jgi:hypothetical protein
LRTLLTTCVAAIFLATSTAEAPAQQTTPDDFVAIATVINTKTDPPYATFFEVLKQKGRKIGHSKIRCRFPHRGESHCRARIRVESGAIFAKGPVGRRDGGSVLPIIGGSGIYSAARGEFRFKSIAHKKSRETFIFR